jgi:hypothetical protein
MPTARQYALLVQLQAPTSSLPAGGKQLQALHAATSTRWLANIDHLAVSQTMTKLQSWTLSL